MNDTLSLAVQLADRNYTTVVFREIADDNEVLFVALNPELEGCVVQGLTPDEALESLASFRVEYIAHLLEHGLTVPDPEPLVAAPQVVHRDMPTFREIDPQSKNPIDPATETSVGPLAMTS